MGVERRAGSSFEGIGGYRLSGSCRSALFREPNARGQWEPLASCDSVHMSIRAYALARPSGDWSQRSAN